MYYRCIVTYLKSLGAKIVVSGHFSLSRVGNLDFLLKHYKNPLGLKIYSIKNSFKVFKIHFKGFWANVGQNKA